MNKTLLALITVAVGSLSAARFPEPTVVTPPPVASVLAEPVVTLPVFAGYEADWQQAHDAMIVRVVEAFNVEKGWVAGHPHRLDPVLVKAWALQESGGDREIFVSGDLMQMNNAGDWAPEKRWFGVEPGEQLTPERSLSAALQWAYLKGQETRRMSGTLPATGWHRTVRDGAIVDRYESRFTGWERALRRYNGGGVADYHGRISRRVASVG